MKSIEKKWSIFMAEQRKIEQAKKKDKRSENDRTTNKN